MGTDERVDRGNPTVEFLIDYWGGCPECGMQDGDCELGADLWFYCDVHWTRWNTGTRGLADYSRPVYGKRRREILGYRFVPWEDRPVDPVWREGATPESVAEEWAAIRARFPEIVPCVVPRHLTMTRAKRIDALRDPDGARRAVEARYARGQAGRRGTIWREVRRGSNGAGDDDPVVRGGRRDGDSLHRAATDSDAATETPGGQTG
jgi:hypothetical protein